MIKKNIYLITGSEGFIGNNLVRFALENNYNFYAPKLKELNLLNSSQVKKYISGKNITHCIHSATTLRSGTNYPENVCERNLRMFFNLEKYLPAETKLINFGSGSEYNRENWIPQMNEKYFDNFIPSDSHSYAKYIISKYIKDSKQEREMTTFRIFGIFGEGEDYRYKFISNVIAKSLCMIQPTINQDALYDYIDIKDFCKLCFNLCNNSKTYANSSINICTSRPILLSTLTEKINLILGLDKNNYTINNKSLGREYSGDNSLMNNLIDKNFNFNEVDISLKRLIDYYKSISKSLDKKELLKDSFLDYAKKIMRK